MSKIVVDIFESLAPFEPDQLLFPNVNGKIANEPIWPIRQAFRDSDLNDGIDDKKMTASFHTFRHTFASRLVQRGVDLYRVQKLMGHSTMKVTERYAKLVDANLEDAIEVLNNPPTKPTPESPSPASEKNGNGKVIPFRRPA